MFVGRGQDSARRRIEHRPFSRGDV